MLFIKVTKTQYTIVTNITFVLNFHNMRIFNCVKNAILQIHPMRNTVETAVKKLTHLRALLKTHMGGLTSVYLFYGQRKLLKVYIFGIIHLN